MNQPLNSLHALRLVTDRPSLNFANTVDPREGSGAVDYLQTYADLAAWAARAGVVSQATASRLVRRARARSAHSGRAFERARQLREAIYRIFCRLATHRPVFAADLALLRAGFYDALSAARLEQHGRSFRWRLGEHLEVIRWKIARDAVELLESGLLERLKRCAGSGDCGWVFIDTSKNSSRRWCSMAGCGNRAKARRHLRRRDSH